MRTVAPPRRARLLRTVAVLALAALATTMLPGTLAPAAADPDGTITLPAQQSSEQFELMQVNASSPDGMLLRHDSTVAGQSTVGRVWLTADGTVHDVPPDAPHETGFISGSVFTAAARDIGGATIRRYDLASRSPASGDGTPASQSLVGVTTEGWIEHDRSYPLTLRRPGKPDVVLAPTEGRTSVVWPKAMGKDVYWAEPADRPRRIMSFDELSGGFTTIATITDIDIEILKIYVAPNVVAWIEHRPTPTNSDPEHWLCTVRRTSPVPSPTCVVGAELYNVPFAVTDTHLFKAHPTTNGYRFSTAPLSEPDNRTEITAGGTVLESDNYQPAVILGDGLAVVTNKKYSLEHVVSGAAEAETLVPSKPLPADVVGLALGPGRVVAADNRAFVEVGGDARTTADNAYPAVARSLTRAPALAVGDETPLASDVFRSPSGRSLRISGARSLHVSSPVVSGKPCSLTLVDAGKSPTSLAMGDCDTAALSGPYVAGAFVDAAAGTSQVRSTDGRVLMNIPCAVPGKVALFGSRVAYPDENGTLMLHDFALPTSSSNPRAIAAFGCAGTDTLSMWGSKLVVTGSSSSTIHDLASGTSVQGPAMRNPQVADGVAVWVSPTGSPRTLYAYDLASPATSPVGIGGIAPNEQFSVDDHLVAWQDASTRAIKVAPLPFGQAAPHPPRLLGSIAPNTLKTEPTGAVSPWHAEFDVTKPLGSWKLELRNAAGTVVKAWSGSAPLGGIRVDWDGKVDGRWAAGGRYTWTLTGNAADGEGTLRNLDGQAVALTGTVTVKDAHVRDLGYDRLADLAAVDSAGVAWRFNGRSTGNFFWPLKLGSGWGAYNAIVNTGDLTGDGYPDLLARDSAGTLYRYDGTGTGTFKPRVTLGTGWQRFTSLVGAGDLTGDGRRDLLARDSTGVLHRYDGTGTGGFKAKVQVATGWQAYTAIVGTGDLTSDGRPDVLVRDSLGTLFRYDGTGSGGFAPAVKLGTGWGGFTAFVAIGDVTGDGHGDLLARDSAGVTYRYPGTGRGTFGARVSLGTGYKAYTRMF